MDISLESIQIGQCYLTQDGEVRRVLGLTAEKRVHYEYWRVGKRAFRNWKPGIEDLRSFALSLERPVPNDWTPGRAGEGLASTNVSQILGKR